MRGDGKIKREAEKFVISLPDSGKILHKKVGKTFHIFCRMYQKPVDALNPASSKWQITD